MSKQSTEVAIIEQLNNNGMEKTAAEALLSSYGVPFVEAGKLIEQGRQIVVSDESDTDNMALARTTRLALRSQRIAIEKKHDELKADSLAYGKAVDLVQRVALEQIKPVEEHLQLQEKFAEVQQEKRRQETINKRTAELAKYVDDVSVYNYGDMGDDAFALLIDQVKNAKELADKKAADEAAAIEKARVEKEEADRIAREKAEAELAAEREANQKKLNRISQLSTMGLSFVGDGYKFDNMTFTEKQINSATDEEWDKLIAGATEYIDKVKAEQEAQAAEQAKAAAAEADRVKKIEEQAAADRKAAEDAAREKAAAEAAEAKRITDEKAAAEAAQAAPDKEKLLSYVNQLRAEHTFTDSEKGSKVFNRIDEHLKKSVEAYIKLINEEL